MRIFIISHEGKLQNTATVIAQSEVEAVVKYYMAASYCGIEFGKKGHKNFIIGDATDSDNLPSMKEHTMFHHDDIYDESFLNDVNPITQWIKYGYHNLKN